VSAPALALGQGYVPGYASQHPGVRAGPRCCEDRHPRGGNCRLIRESHSRTPSLAHRGRRRARRLRSLRYPLRLYAVPAAVRDACPGDRRALGHPAQRLGARAATHSPSCDGIWP